MEREGDRGRQGERVGFEGAGWFEVVLVWAAAQGEAAGCPACRLPPLLPLLPPLAPTTAQRGWIDARSAAGHAPVMRRYRSSTSCISLSKWEVAS